MTQTQKVNVIQSFIVSTLLTFASFGFASYFGFIAEINWLEVFSIWTSCLCLVLFVLRNQDGN